MKKFVSFLLAVLILAGVGVTAFAEEGPDPDFTFSQDTSGPATLDVKASYEPAATSEVYYVDVSWSGMVFTYHAKVPGVWNADDLKYGEETPAHWESSDGNGYGTVTLTNRSAPVAGDEGFIVSFSFAGNESIVPTVGIGGPRIKISSVASSEELNYAALNEQGSSRNNVVGLPATTELNKTTTVSRYFLPGISGGMYDFGKDVSWGTLTITVTHNVVEDPGIPEGPGIDSVSPAPEAGEMAANG